MGHLPGEGGLLVEFWWFFQTRTFNCARLGSGETPAVVWPPWFQKTMVSPLHRDGTARRELRSAKKKTKLRIAGPGASNTPPKFHEKTPK